MSTPRTSTPRPQDDGRRDAPPGEVPVIDVDGLRALLERGADVTVLDVRPAAEREEWCIPGSLHADAYQDLRAGDDSALADAPLRRDAPVVTVCAQGRTSLLAARLLRQRGFDASSLAGGMKAWSLAWNAAELSGPGATLIQVRRTGKGCLSYVVGSGSEAVVVDPSLSPEVYLEMARARGWRIGHVLDTHIHADHLSRSRALAALAGARLWLPVQGRTRFAHDVVRDGTELRFGETGLRALFTPGHTPESTSYLMDGRWLLTGDTLFPTSVGRPDLEAEGDGARERALLLHASLRRLLALDPEVLVLPCHTGGPVPFDGRVAGAALAAVRGAIRLPEDAAEFAADVLSKIPETPPNYHAIVEWNEAGELPPGDPTDLEAGANRCAIS